MLAELGRPVRVGLFKGSIPYLQRRRLGGMCPDLPTWSTMSRVSKHSGTRAARPAARVPRQQLLVLAAGITATLVVWGVLVFAAIEFGKQGRSGETSGWVFLALSTIGAAACLFVTLILGSKAFEVLGSRGTPVEPAAGVPGMSAGPAPAPRVPGGRRAAR